MISRNCIGKKLDTPFKSDRKYKKLQVCVKDGSNIINIHFGDKRYKQNYSKKAWRSYSARSAGIRNKEGKLTKNLKTSANYWARKVLWNRK